MPNPWNISDRILGGMAAGRPMPMPQPYAPAPQPYQPPFQPDAYRPTPQPYAPAPQPYQPPQPYAPAPQPYQPPRPYAPAPQPYQPAPQPYTPLPAPVRPVSTGKVAALNPSNFKQAVLDTPGLVLVDFYATYCGPCKTMAPHLDRLAADQANQLHVGKVTCDRDGGSLAQQYRVRAYPTLVAFKDGKEIGRCEGGLDHAQLVEWMGRGFPKIG